MPPAGGCAAKNPTNRSPTQIGRQLDDWQTVNGIDATSRVANNACPPVLSSILGSQCGGQRPREDRLERCCLVRRCRLKYTATAPAENTSKTTLTAAEEHGRRERKVHMDCKPAGLTTEVAGDCSNEHPETSAPRGELVGTKPSHVSIYPGTSACWPLTTPC